MSDSEREPVEREVFIVSVVRKTEPTAYGSYGHEVEIARLPSRREAARLAAAIYRDPSNDEVKVRKEVEWQ